MSLLLNMLSRLVITFLPRSKCLLISWLQSPSAVILEPRKTKSATISIVSPSICHEVMGLDAMIFVFWMLSFKLIVSFQFSCSVVSDSLRPHELQHTRPPCLSPTPGVHSDSHPLSQWCHPAISSFVVPSPPAPNPSQHHSLFQWVNSSHEVAKVLEFQASASVLPMNTRDWSPLGWTGWISL